MDSAEEKRGEKEASEKPSLPTHPPEYCPECHTRTGGGRCLRCAEGGNDGTQSFESYK